MHNYHTALGAFPMTETVAFAYGGYSTDWGAWSAQSLLLGYMEGQPIYNACNFTWTVWCGNGVQINSTVPTPSSTRSSARRTASLPTPQASVAISGPGTPTITSPACGTTTDPGANDSTGVFARINSLWDPEDPRRHLEHDRVLRGAGLG